jgi:hypothetical protein
MRRGAAIVICVLFPAAASSAVREAPSKRGPHALAGNTDQPAAHAGALGNPTYPKEARSRLKLSIRIC